MAASFGLYVNDQMLKLICVQVVNDIDQSNWGIVYTMYKTNIPLNDYHTAVPDPEKLRTRKESFLVPSQLGLCLKPNVKIEFFEVNNKINQ